MNLLATLKPRDRRALSWLGVSALLTLVVYFWPDSVGVSNTVAATNNDPTALAAHLTKLRATAATVPAKNDVLKKVSADLALREKGLLKADTVPQAQAQLMQILRRTMQAERPALEIRSTELNGIKPLGDHYGEVSVAVQLDCKIDQLVNFLAALPAQPELIATSDLRIISSNAKEKTVNVRVTISGVVPQKLIPQKLLPQKPSTQRSKPAGAA